MQSFACVDTLLPRKKVPLFSAPAMNEHNIRKFLPPVNHLAKKVHPGY